MLVRAGNVVPGTYAGACEMTTIGDTIGEVDHCTIQIITDRNAATPAPQRGLELS